jgi:CPA1 family monovalent cation:H+ antiporter
MADSIEHLGALLLVAAVVAVLTRKLHVPYSVGLVATGMFLALFSVEPDIRLTRDLIFSTLLPPLIFEAAMVLRWRELRPDLLLIIALATVGLVLAAALTAAGMHWLAGWHWVAASLFGVLIAATDPVSVIALFKEAGVRGRLRTLVETESLFNDGTAAVLFTVGAAFAAGQTVTPGLFGIWLLRSIGGGILCGALVARVILALANRTDDHLVKLTLTTIAAYGSFLLAEHFKGSGVLATLCAGLLIGNLGQAGPASARARLAIEAFWEFAAFVSNSLIFLLIGIHEEQQNFHSVWQPAIIAIGLVTLGRAVAIYPVCALFAQGANPVSLRHQHLLVWGGLRGALALALALSLPSELPDREAIAAVAFAVVAFSIFAQGLSITPLLRRLGQIPPSPRASPEAEPGRRG